MSIGDIEKSGKEIISKFNLDKIDVMDTLRATSIFVIIYVVYTLWRKSRGQQ